MYFDIAECIFSIFLMCAGIFISVRFRHELNIDSGIVSILLLNVKDSMSVDTNADSPIAVTESGIITSVILQP